MCVCVGVLFVQCQRRPEEGAEVELQEVVSLLMMVLASEPGSLQEHQVSFFTTEPSLQPPHLIISIKKVYFMSVGILPVCVPGVHEGAHWILWNCSYREGVATEVLGIKPGPSGKAATVLS